MQTEDGVKSYSSREVIQKLKDDGWYEVACEGSHHQFKHPTKPGKTTVKHPQKNVPTKTLKRIQQQSGVVFD
jgi:predicted RNA binding protein YcfA (HicA-like mRNA interferase family)